jgi:hypothetical protein
MSRARDAWRQLVRARMYHPDAPGSERYWVPETETASRARLRELQHLNALARADLDEPPRRRATDDRVERAQQNPMRPEHEVDAAQVVARTDGTRIVRRQLV